MKKFADHLRIENVTVSERWLQKFKKTSIF